MAANQKRLVLIGLLAFVLILGAGIAVFVTRGSSNSYTDGSGTTSTDSAVVTDEPVVTTGGKGGGNGGNQPSPGTVPPKADVGTFQTVIPQGVTDYKQFSGAIDAVSYTHGPVSIALTAQAENTGDSVSSVTELYGDFHKAERFNIGGNTGYLYQSKSAGRVVLTGVSLLYHNVFTITATAPPGQLARAKFELKHVAQAIKARTPNG